MNIYRRTVLKIRDVFLKEWELSTKSAYFILALSIISEQAGTACLEASDGYRIASFSILTAILYTFTYFTFGKILSRIDLAVAYATWSAVGSVGAALMGVFLFSQPLSLVGWLSIAGMVVGVVLLNIYGTPPGNTEDSSGESGGPGQDREVAQ